MSNHTQPWPFLKLVRLHPSVPAIEIEPLTAPLTAPARPVICVVCGGGGVRSEDRHGAEPRECSVCQGQGEIGGGL